jgi:hypothetical protein
LRRKDKIEGIKGEEDVGEDSILATPAPSASTPFQFYFLIILSFGLALAAFLLR